jgi:hypothetical protein
MERSAPARNRRAQGREKKDEQEDAAAADNAGDLIAHGNVSGALGGMLGHRLGKALRKAESSTTSGAGCSGAQGGGPAITSDTVSLPTGSAGASRTVPADYKKVERTHTDPRAEGAAARCAAAPAPDPLTSRPAQDPGDAAPGWASPNPGAPSGAPRKEHR